MSNALGALQRLGKALMLPVAVLPIAGLLLRLGADDILIRLGLDHIEALRFISKAGGAVFENLPLIFAIGVAVGLSEGDSGAAGLAGGVGYLILTAAVSAIDKSINMGVFSGIVMGVCGGFFYNRFHMIRLPESLSFFGGKRFVPIVTGASAIVLAGIFGWIWPPFQNGLNFVGGYIVNSGPLGAFVYGTLNRLLIPTGLHHVLNNMAWFVFGSFTGADGGVVTGDLHRYFAGDPAAGIYMAGFFPMMMFGLPAACLAMYTTARSQARKNVAGILFGAAFTSLLTGVTEPVEFLFMFLAPLLFVLHAILTGISLAACTILGVKHGFTFSAGAIDFILNWGLATKPWLLFAIGLAVFTVYYTLFVFFIKTFNLKTPGRLDESEFLNKRAQKITMSTLAGNYLKALGGHENLTHIDSCITRLRLSVKDRTLVDDSGLKRLGARGIVNIGEHNIQVIVGTGAGNLASEMSKLDSRGEGDSCDTGSIPAENTSGGSVSDFDEIKICKEKENLSHNGNLLHILAPVSGKVLPLENVPDKVFSEKLVGDGIAIYPEDHCLSAPCDGVIGKIFESNHAFSMQTDHGIELFVHFGLDTVELKGDGFQRLAQEGQNVKTGDKIISFDLEHLKSRVKNIVTPVVISNMEVVVSIDKGAGSVKRGRDVIMTVRL